MATRGQDRTLEMLQLCLCVILQSNANYYFVFQDFKVLTLLGKGSFACVYRAKSVNTGLEVAIKMVRVHGVFN